MIRVRDDDVLVHSRGHKDPLARLKMVHEMIVDGGALHVPSILVTEIQEFPKAIKFIRNESIVGRMEVQWHGFEHVDYGKKTASEIQEDIVKSQEFFYDSFGVKFTKFYTPWGASSSIIKDACALHSVEMVDCTNWVRCVHINRNPEQFIGKDIEITIHWWEGVGRLRSALNKLKE